MAVVQWLTHLVVQQNKCGALSENNLHGSQIPVLSPELFGGMTLLEEVCH